MANAKKNWSTEDYSTEALEFVTCYGKNFDWHEFVYEYCRDFQHAKLKKPVPGMLLAAIQATIKKG
jgi:hypothetical protein